MAVVAKGSHDESVLILTLTDVMNEQAITEAYILSIAMAQEISGPVYRVFDIRQADSSYQEIVSVLQTIGRGLTGAMIAPEMAAIFVGQKSMQPFFTDTMKMPFVEDMDTALEYARSHASFPLPA